MSSSDDEIEFLEDSETGYSSSEPDIDSGCIDDEEENEDEYEVLSLDDVISQMRSISEEVSQVINLAPAACRLLLKYYKWDKARFMDEFTACPEPDVFLSERINIDSSESLKFNSFQGECDICFCEGDLSAFKCGHTACKDCWNHYITVQVKDENLLDVKCIVGTCGIVLDDEQVLSFLLDPEMKMLYCRALSHGFVDANRLLKWCPGTDCGRVIKFHHPCAQSVFCVCGCSFCSSCGVDAHSPLSCQHLEKWEAKSKEDNDSKKWILQNTKPCPACRAPIEKTSGCNYMMCTRPSCRAYFCWACLQVFARNHQHHNCHRFEGPVHNGGDDLDGERFEHYKHRMKMHEKSSELEKKLTSKISIVTNRMTRLAQQTSVKLALLPESVASLNRCRQVLTYTYPFIFFMANDLNKDILDSNLKDLEVATEQLSAIIDRDVCTATEENFDRIWVKLREKTTYVDRRRQVLLKHCAELLDQ